MPSSNPVISSSAKCLQALWRWPFSQVCGESFAGSWSVREEGGALCDTKLLYQKIERSTGCETMQVGWI